MSQDIRKRIKIKFKLSNCVSLVNPKRRLDRPRFFIVQKASIRKQKPFVHINLSKKRTKRTKYFWRTSYAKHARKAHSKKVPNSVDLRDQIKEQLKILQGRLPKKSLLSIPMDDEISDDDTFTRKSSPSTITVKSIIERNRSALKKTNPLVHEFPISATACKNKSEINHTESAECNTRSADVASKTGKIVESQSPTDKSKSEKVPATYPKTVEVQTEIEHVNPEESVTDKNTVKPNQIKLIDSLYSKLKCVDVSVESSESLNASVSLDRLTSADEAELLANCMEDGEVSDSSNEFYGFSEPEYKLDKPNIPGLLATPIVLRPSNKQSAFVSKSCDNFMRSHSLESKNDNINMPIMSRELEEGMVIDGSLPPRLECPMRPLNMMKARTVAQKRVILESRSNLKFSMIETESTIFHELKKRDKVAGSSINYSVIQAIQRENIPFTRDCWRAVVWLATEKSHYFFHTINVDGEVFKLYGSRGNNKFREINYQSSLPLARIQPYPVNDECTIRFPLPKYLSVFFPTDYAMLCGLAVPKPGMDIEDRLVQSRIQIPFARRRHVVSRPGPLTSKLRRTSLGPLEAYVMPKVELEVWPHCNRPLAECVRPYLKIAMPFECITSEWARFSVSTLQKRKHISKKAIAAALAASSNAPPTSLQSYKFAIPYRNDQNKILVRRRKSGGGHGFGGLRNIGDCMDYEPLSFAKHINRKDRVTLEVADCLTAMINSVGISISENEFITDDPDGNYDHGREQPILESSFKKPTKGADKNDCTFNLKNRSTTSRVRNELKRLSATIIETKSINMKEECSTVFCKYGCICESISTPSVVWKSHCQNSSCIFECSCEKRPEKNGGEYLSEELRVLQEKARSRLAKEEKEFRSTIVLTNSNTVLIRNTENESRRSIKIPKRYTDSWERKNRESENTSYISPTLSSNATNNLNTVPTNPIEITDKRDVKPQLKHATAFVPMCSKTSVEINRMRHVSVSLRRLEQLDTIEPWCMIHNLYKCFCKGLAVEGEPFVLNRVNDNEDMQLDIDPNMLPLEYVAMPQKRNYTFVRDEDDVKSQNYIATNKSMEPSQKIAKSMVHSFEKHLPSANTSSGTTARFHQIDLTVQKLKNKNRYQENMIVHQREMKDKKRSALLEKRVQACCLFTREKMINIRRLLPNATATHSTLAQKTDLVEPVVISDDENDNKGDTISKSSVTTKERAPVVTRHRSTDTRVQQIIGGFKAPSDHIHRINSIVTSTMQMICSLQKRNVSDMPMPRPNALNTISWEMLLDSYRRGIVDVYCLIIRSGYLLLVSHTEVQPPAQSFKMFNIRTASADTYMPYLARLLRKSVFTTKMTTMSILLFGYRGFWRVLGAIHSGNNYLNHGIIVKPTPTTHPSIANKISKLYEQLVRTNWKGVESSDVSDNQLNDPNISCDMKKTTATATITTNIDLNSASSTKAYEPIKITKLHTIGTTQSTSVPQKVPNATVVPTVTAVEAEAKETKEVASAAAEKRRPSTSLAQLTSASRSVTRVKPTATKSPPRQIKIASAPIKNACNIRIHKDAIDIENTHLYALPMLRDQKWFMLEMRDDFTDIFIPTWKNFISVEKIKTMVSLASKNKKTVKIGSSTSKVLPEIYVTPASMNKIFLGPYNITENIDIVLCSNYGGNKLARENFESINCIHRLPSERSTGKWLYKSNNVTEHKSQLSIAPPATTGFENSRSPSTKSPKIRPLRALLPKDSLIVTTNTNSNNLLSTVSTPVVLKNSYPLVENIPNITNRDVLEETQGLKFPLKSFMLNSEVSVVPEDTLRVDTKKTVTESGVDSDYLDDIEVIEDLTSHEVIEIVTSDEEDDKQTNEKVKTGIASSINKDSDTMSIINASSSALSTLSTLVTPVFDLTEQADANNDITVAEDQIIHDKIVSGFVISNIAELGRIRAEKVVSNHSINLIRFRKTFSSLQLVDNFLNKWISDSIYSFAPPRLEPKWYFTTDLSLSYLYPNNRTIVLNKNQLITLYGVFNVHEKIHQYLVDRNTYFQIMLLQLAALLVPKTEINKISGISILRKAVVLIHTLEEKASTLEKSKKRHVDELAAKKLILAGHSNVVVKKRLKHGAQRKLPLPTSASSVAIASKAAPPPMPSLLRIVTVNNSDNDSAANIIVIDDD